MGLSNKLPGVDAAGGDLGPHFEKNYIKAMEILWNISIIFRIELQYISITLATSGRTRILDRRGSSFNRALSISYDFMYPGS